MRGPMLMTLLLALAATPGSAEAGWWSNWFKREVPDNQAGRAAYERGEYERSAERFDDVTRGSRGENSRRAEFNRGNALAKAGRDEEARRAFSAAAQSADPKLRSDALHNRGWIREQKKDTSGAIEDYREALVANADNERARMNLERLLRQVPPPPQEQPQDGESDPNESEGEETEQAQSSPDGENDEEEDTGPSEPEEGDGTGEPEQGPGEQPEEEKAEREGEASADGELSEKEADAMLDAIERESRHPPLGTRERPPRDYDPQRDW